MRIPAHLLMLVLLMCALAWPLNAEILNLNHDMELGRPGDGVPGYFLEINNVSRASVVAAPGKRYLLRTVAAGNPGQALVLPGFEGVCRASIKLPDFLVTRDAEVELAFDAKSGPDEKGVYHAEFQYVVDFRTSGGAYAPPMVKTFGFKPGKEWQRFSWRFPVQKRSTVYSLYIKSGAAEHLVGSGRVVLYH